jgi:hypothetical protein
MCLCKILILVLLSRAITIAQDDFFNRFNANARVPGCSSPLSALRCQCGFASSLRPPPIGRRLGIRSF